MEIFAKIVDLCEVHSYGTVLTTTFHE